MKKLFIVLQFFFLLGLIFSIGLSLSGQSNDKTTQSNYIIARYVIGSGGVTNATSPNHFHSATAGETIVGGAESENNFLLSGYWHGGASGTTGVEPQENAIVPQAFELHQNHPNPFNPQTIIEYDLPQESRVTVEILNLVGQRIRLLTNSQQQGPGFMQLVWNGCDDQGKLMGSGIYIYRVSVYANDRGDQKPQMLFQQSKKMLFVK
ncbi:MAG: FlgD immunoglobulin-like domain containing protein [bacterium]|nr:FlgD immunoglobulin-like domain containing protein [bacterium]